MDTKINSVEEYDKMDYIRKRYFLFEMMKYPINDREIIKKVLGECIGSYPIKFVDKIIEGKHDEIIKWLLENEFFYMNYSYAIEYYFTIKRYDMIDFFINKFNGISTNTWAGSLIECARVGNLEEFKYLIELIPKIYVSNDKSKEYGIEKELRLFSISGFHCYFNDDDTNEYIINYIINISYKNSLRQGKENIKQYIINNKLQ